LENRSDAFQCLADGQDETKIFVGGVFQYVGKTFKHVGGVFQYVGAAEKSIGSLLEEPMNLASASETFAYPPSEIAKCPVRVAKPSVSVRITSSATETPNTEDELKRRRAIYG
jgi:hypothetical protein